MQLARKIYISHTVFFLFSTVGKVTMGDSLQCSWDDS